MYSKAIKASINSCKNIGYLESFSMTKKSDNPKKIRLIAFSCKLDLASSPSLRPTTLSKGVAVER
jgi:hypothetical protein